MFSEFLPRPSCGKLEATPYCFTVGSLLSVASLYSCTSYFVVVTLWLLFLFRLIAVRLDLSSFRVRISFFVTRVVKTLIISLMLGLLLIVGGVNQFRM